MASHVPEYAASYGLQRLCSLLVLHRLGPFSGSSFKNAFEILNVSGRSAILIHAGNSGADTLGCFLPGRTFANGRVGGSVLTRDALFERIRFHNKARIEIVNGED